MRPHLIRSLCVSRLLIEDQYQGGSHLRLLLELLQGDKVGENLHAPTYLPTYLINLITLAQTIVAISALIAQGLQADKESHCYCMRKCNTVAAVGARSLGRHEVIAAP